MTAPVDRYAVLASAIASRRLQVEAAESDQPTYTDGRTIFVDPGAEPADIRDGVAAQALLLAAGSLEKNVMIRLARTRRGVAERYLALELARAGARLGSVLPARILSRLEAGAGEPVSDSNEESLQRALSRETISPAPQWAGTLLPGKLRRAAESELLASPSDEELEMLGKLEDELETDDDEDDGDEDESKILKLLSAPGMSNPLSDAIQRLFGRSRGSADKNQGGSEIPVARQRFGQVGGNARRSPLAQMISGAFTASQVHGIMYPEFDCHRGEYRPDWCSVTEFDPAERELAPQLALSGSTLQRPLARVGIEAQRHRRQPEGDSLDLTALVDYEVDRAHGDDPDPNIYESRRLTKRDLSVLVLLDCSGSTAEYSTGRTVFEEERELAGQLTVGLERLGDRVGTYGFYSRGKDAVTFLRIKEFNARFDSAAKRRLRSVQPGGFTRIGAAIRHATHVLESHAQAKNMVLVVVGDGLPYDDGYEDRYARADARQAIEEAIQRGIGVVGLGIRSSTEPQVLEEVWSVAPFRVIDDVRDVQRHLRGLLLNALSATRSNGRRREVRTAEHYNRLRSVNATSRSRLNSYG